jgi:hypothetical protein
LPIADFSHNGTKSQIKKYHHLRVLVSLWQKENRKSSMRRHVESLSRFAAGIRNDKKLFFCLKNALSLGAKPRHLPFGLGQRPARRFSVVNGRPVGYHDNRHEPKT